MFLDASKNTGQWKRVVYLCATTFLGLMLSFLIHAGLEMGYLKWAESEDIIVHFYGGCALPPLLQIIIWLAGGMGGFSLGLYWWRMVYGKK